MSISALRSRLVACAASLVLAGMVLPAHAGDGENKLPCLNVHNGKAAFTVATEGKKKKPDITGGAFTTTWELHARSCPGATYVLTVLPDKEGEPLGWQTGEGTRAWGTDPTQPWPRTDGMPDEESHTLHPLLVEESGPVITFRGDGIVHTFVVKGTTGSDYDHNCIKLRVDTYLADGTEQDTEYFTDTAEYTDCDDGNQPGTSYN